MAVLAASLALPLQPLAVWTVLLPLLGLRPLTFRAILLPRLVLPLGPLPLRAVQWQPLRPKALLLALPALSRLALTLLLPALLGRTLLLRLTLLLAPRRVAGLLAAWPLRRLPALLGLAALILLTEQALPLLGLAPLALLLLPRRLLVLGLWRSRLLARPWPQPVGEVLPRLSRLSHLRGLPRLARLSLLTRLPGTLLDRSVQPRDQFRRHVRLEPRPRRTLAGAR
ncbi:hypothetical protein AB0878_45200 [Amycolatopsis sp. NPDC047767]|uniref:hypothetical protein n=1 Tax=Amycolatopsis sp. NPDC047767 TaxID=3156765 RepID=UPI003451B4AA